MAKRVMTLLATGDLHGTSQNPVGRLDNVELTQIEKWREVCAIAHVNDASAILQPGDIFDSASVADTTKGRVGQMFRNAPCPVISIPGNHDLFGHNETTLPRTPYRLLSRLGCFKNVHRSFEAIGRNVFVTGHGYTTETDTPDGAHQFDPLTYEPRLPVGVGTITIHLVHSMLMVKKPSYDMRHTLIDDVQTSADVIVCGHHHGGFGIYKRRDGKIFINPGALTRLSAHEHEINRQVQVALIHIYDDRHIECELVPLKCAKPGNQVLTREHLERKSEQEDKLEHFLAILANEGEAKFLDLIEIVDDISARENIPANVKAEALERIARAREILGVDL